MSEDSYHLGVKALITNADGAILLLKVNPANMKKNQHGEYWDLPGGRVQQDSTVQETLQREVEEELGVPGIEFVRHLGMVLSNIRIPISDGKSVGLILSIYECRWPEDADIQISPEHTAHQWFSPRQAAELLHIKYPQDFCELVADLES